MLHRSSSSLCAALTLALGLTACGDSKQAPPQHDRQDRTKVEQRLPSVVDERDDRKMTAAAPAPVVPAIVQEAPRAPTPPSIPVAETYGEHLEIGKRLARQGRGEDAIALFEKAASMRPKQLSPRVELARTYLELGKPSSARAHAVAAVELTPTSSHAWNTLGRIELAQGDAEAAIASFQRATEENEDNSYAWNNLGYTFILLERWEEAADALERATSGAQPSGYMWNNLGIAYEHLDRLTEARAAYRQAAEAGSDKARASLTRLEGVTSIKPTSSKNPEPEDDEDSPLIVPEPSGD